MSKSLDISTFHPLNEINYIVEYLNQIESDIFSNSKLMIILPDRISINNLKELLTLQHGPSTNLKIEFTTFENLAIDIISKIDKRPEIAPPEIRRFILCDCIADLAKNDNFMAQKIWDLIKNSRIKENEQVIKNIDNEFEDFLRCAYPPQLENESKVYLNIMKKIARDIEAIYYKESSLDGLIFFEKLEKKAREKLLQIKFDNYYLSRLHILGKATNILLEDNRIINKIFPQIKKIWISAISVFDVSVIELIDALLKCNLSVRINIGSQSSVRLKERLAKRWDIETISETNDKIKNLQYELIELPDIRRETEYLASDIVTKMINKEVKPNEICVFARDAGQYMPYIKAIMEDYGLTDYIQTRRSLALTPAFRLLGCVLDLLTLVEKNEQIIASQITDPLRLGFTVRWDKKNSKPVPDKEFLYVESRVEVTSKGKPHKWDYWKEKINGLNHRLDQLINWIENNKNNPSISKLTELLVKFSQGASCWKKQHIASTGFKENIGRLTDEHITSHSNRILSNLYRIENFAKISKELSNKSEFKWIDIRRAFYSTIGSETYGTPNRNANAIRFIDAGNSHFIGSKYRYILGMKSGRFPRKYPSGRLLTDEFRKKINAEKSELYLRDPETDYENEYDFFEAVTGPGDYVSLIFTMPYLDDRGHSEEWSNFVNTKKFTPEHFKASNFVISKTDTFSPRAHWRETAIRSRDNNSPIECFQEIISPLWKEHNIIKDEIVPRLSTFENVVIKRKLIIDIKHDEEPYLSKFINELKNKPVPAHEINLLEECPMMYYFYKFLFCLGPHTKNRKEGKREFIPEWKFDYNLGNIPLPIRRRHISTFTDNLLKDIIDQYSNINALKNNKLNILQKISEFKGLEYWSKDRLRKIIQEIILDYDSTTKIEYVESGKSKSEEDLWRPGYLKIQGDDTQLIYYARASPRFLSSSDFRNRIPHILNRNGKQVKVPGSNNHYGIIEDDDFYVYKENIKRLNFSTDWISINRCEDCVYKNLCGEWRFNL